MCLTDPTENLEVDGKKNIEDKKEGREHHDFSREGELLTKKNDSKLSGEDEEKYRGRDRYDRKVLIEHIFELRDLLEIATPMKLRDDREHEGDDRRDEDIWHPDHRKIVRIVSSVDTSEEIYDELHVDLTQDISDICRDHDPESILDDLLYERLFDNRPYWTQVGEIVIFIEAKKTIEYSDDEADDPGPCVILEISESGFPEKYRKQKTSNHAEEFGSFL